MDSRWSRRQFLKTTAAAVVLGAAENTLGAASSLPKRRLGKTGAMVSCIGFGSGTRFCSIENEDAAQTLLERAFTFGINYFDTAGSYTRRGIERLSEKRLGDFIKPRRKDIFLATKIDPRDRDGALRSVETSLKFLQTDYIDLIQIHSLSNLDDLERIASASGVLNAVRELREQKVARFIGITGHNDGAAMAEALRRYDFDTVLMALNAAQSANPIAQRKMEPIPAFESAALPVALQKNMGILSMKVMGQGMLVGSGTGRAFRRRAFAIQFKPARRQRHHRLRAIGAAGAKRSSRLEFYPARRNRQAEIARTSRAVALSLGEILARP